MDRKVSFLIITLVTGLVAEDVPRLFLPTNGLFSTGLWGLYFSEDGLNEVNINAYIRTMLENFKETMKLGLPDMGIPVLDPFTPDNQTLNTYDERYVNLTLLLGNINITGLSDFITKHLWVSVRRLEVEILLQIPELRALADYNLSGSAVRVIPLFGHGKARVDADDLDVGMTATLTTTEDKEHIQLKEDFKITIDFRRAFIDFENLLGGREWTVAIQQFFNRVNRGVFRYVMIQVEGPLHSALLDAINAQLKTLPIKGIDPGNSANEYVDQLLYLMRDESLEIDPMMLPNYTYDFSKTVMGITWNGEAKLYEGELRGISSLNRTGNCTLHFTNDTMTISASLGVENLHLTYKGHAKFMGVGPSIACNGTVESMSLFFQVSQSNKRGSKPTLEEFEIVELGDIDINLTGMGPLTWIVEKLMSGTISVVKSYLLENVASYLKGFIQDQLEKVKLPFAK